MDDSLFLQDLTERAEEWSPLQGVGDVFVRFCAKLRAYTNFFNNYTTAIRTIDKVGKHSVTLGGEYKDLWPDLSVSLENLVHEIFIY